MRIICVTYIVLKYTLYTRQQNVFFFGGGGGVGVERSGGGGGRGRVGGVRVDVNEELKFL